MGLIVDVPKPVYGNTDNNGNTSRRYFADNELVSKITGIDMNLIYRIKVILDILSSGYKINLNMFSVYTKKISKLYVQHYSWHLMTRTMYKIFKHKFVITEKILLPIGKLSEEAAEPYIKHFRLYCKHFGREFSRASCNMDVLNRQILSSDLIITGMRSSSYKKKTNQFLKETKI